MHIGRNAPCPCGSGKKFKKCCGTLSVADKGRIPDNQTDRDAHTKASQEIKKGREFVAVGKPEQALACYHNAVHLAPDLAEAYDALGDGLSMHRQMQQALSAYQKTAQLNPAYAGVHYKCGTMLLELGRYHEAITAYEEALRQTPDDPNILTNLGSAYLHTKQFDKATTTLEKALKNNPEDVFAYQNYAAALVYLNNFAGAEKILLQGLSVQKDQIDLCIMLASVYLKWRNQIDKARVYAEKIIQQDPLNPAANTIIASHLRRQKKPDEGLALLSKIEIPEHPLLLGRTIHFELGYLHDQLHNCDTAMEHFVRANQLWAQETSVSINNFFNQVKSIRHGYDRLKEKYTAVIHAASTPALEMHPVFMVGFPRSGTTLLDQILDSHPDIEVLEEIPILEVVLHALGEQGNNFAENVMNLREDELSVLRDRYFQEAKKHITSTSVQFVDKFPLNIIYCNLIARLFPGARIIVSLRHPCDVCLSCLMQDFDENEAMAHFTSLEDTALLYAEVMGLWLEYEQNLPVAFQRVHYERLIDSFDDELSSVVDFLGIPWSDNFYQYHKHAASKNTINTPSYSQVVEPLYTRARYRWLRYRKHLQPHLPVLRPFIQAFGYEEE